MARRPIADEDRATFWAAINAGRTIKVASQEAGINYRTGMAWMKKQRDAQPEKVRNAVAAVKADRQKGGKQRDKANEDLAQIELGGPVAQHLLSQAARRGLTDFGFFRRYYLGRASSPWQVEAGVRIAEYLESQDREFVVLNCPPGAGKALALDTPLPTPTGWTTIREVRPGDLVLGADGQPTRVLAKSEVFPADACYTVTTDDGHTVVANAAHLWPVRLHGEGQYKRTGTPDYPNKKGIKTRGDNGIRTQTTEFLARKRLKRPQLAVAAAIDLPDADLPVDPYVLGVWLGDGDTAGPTITQSVEDIDWLREEFHRRGYLTRSRATPTRFGVAGLAEGLRDAGVLGAKHVPDAYLRASIKQRRELVQGLVDTDGHVDHKGRVEFCTTSATLADNMLELVLSLGVKCSLRESRATLYGKDCGPRYRLGFQASWAARMPRKATRCRDGERTPNRYLTVEPTDSVPTQCIQVEGGLFLAGTGMLVTHNSTIMHDVAVWCIVRNRAIRILIGSISKPLADQYTHRIRNTLERTMPLRPNPDDIAKGLAVDAEGCIARDYGRFKPLDKGGLWRRDEFVVEQMDVGVALDNKEPTCSAYGIDSEFIGHRADLVLYDDVVNPTNAREGAGRDHLIEKWDSQAEARCEPGGALFLIGQRLAPTDLYHYCLNKKFYDEDELDENGNPVEYTKYKHIAYKAYYQELDTGPDSRKPTAPAYPNGPLLDPRRLPWRDINQIRQATPVTFDIVYQQEDTDAAMSLVQRVWAMGGVDKETNITYIGCLDHGRLPRQIPSDLPSGPIQSVCTVDPSPTEYWGIQWWLRPTEDPANRRYLVDLERKRQTAEELLGYDTQTGQWIGLMEEWQVASEGTPHRITHWIIEINAAQRFLLAHDYVRQWQRARQVLIVPHTTSSNKMDDKRGIEALLPPLWRHGQIRLPDFSSWKSQALINEVCAWKPDKKKGTDLVMAHWFAELHWPKSVRKPPPKQQWRPTFMRELEYA